MPHDPALADRVADLLTGRDAVRKPMFGGVAFMVNGHLVVAASSRGGLMLKVDPAADPEAHDQMSADDRVEPFVMRGRPMHGWWHIDVDDSVDAEELAGWVAASLSRVDALPARVSPS